MLRAEGHEITFLTGSVFRDRIEDSGAKFVSLPPGADFDGRDILLGVPELKNIPPGLEWFRVAIEQFFLDHIPAQHRGLLQAVQEYRADVIVGDDMFFGVLPMLLGSQSKQPPIVLCGQRAEFACRLRQPRRAALRTSRGSLTKGCQPALLRLNKELSSFDVGPLTPFDSVVELATPMCSCRATLRISTPDPALGAALLRSFQVARCRPAHDSMVRARSCW